MKNKKVQSAPTPEIKAADAEEKVPVEINGATYNLSFDFGDLARAETMFRKQGHVVNLLVSLTSLTLDGVKEVFPCALHRFHPTIGFSEAQSMVTLQSVYPIATAIVEAWNASAKHTAPVAAEGGVDGRS